MENKRLLASVIEKCSDRKMASTALIGFDGFIDEIIHVVKERRSQTEFTRIETILDFSEKLAEAAGLSLNVELVPVKIKLGGNGPILADALMKQGHKINLAGALGKSVINPVFSEIAGKAERIISFAEPGHTDALEFHDGKIMLGKVQYLEEVNWHSLLKSISLEQLKMILEESDLLAFANWTMLPGMNSIIEGFLELLPVLARKPLIFFDLADPHKRTEADLVEVFKLISKMEKLAAVIMSMNKRESGLMAEVMGIEDDLLTARAARLRESLKISYLLIHPVDGAVVSTREESLWLPGPYTAQPVLTTGAGDNFNAGFCHGMLSGFSAQESLVCGLSVSGFYVRNGYAPDKEELVDFMEKWLQDKV